MPKYLMKNIKIVMGEKVNKMFTLRVSSTTFINKYPQSL